MADTAIESLPRLSAHPIGLLAQQPALAPTRPSPARQPL